jgi:catechol 2,3-dioxygenase
MQTHARLNPNLSLGALELTVSTLTRSLEFYQQALGMKLRSSDGQTAQLGTEGRTLLQLTEIPGASPTARNSTGLYHFALLLPTRVDLARFVKHISSLGLRLGQGDHLVSEAFYMNDPDGHGIEVYRDRPRSEWKWNIDQVQMASDPVDVAGMLAEPGADAPWTGLPEGTVMGHFHLRVADLDATRAFYLGVLGFDLVATFPGALFISVGGYHHHFGLNVWQSQGGQPAPASTARLERVHVELPNTDELGHLAARLQAAGIAFTRDDHQLETHDPAGNTLHFSAA